MHKSVGFEKAEGEELNKMREEARAEFEAKYSAEKNYRQLINIYNQALGDRSGNVR